MSFVELQETNALLGNMASENVVPGILIDTENVKVSGGYVTVATVKKGVNRPCSGNCTPHKLQT